MGVYGIAVGVLGFSSYGISVILILTCGIAVSSSSTVCGFSLFWLTVFGEIRLFTVLRYRLFALSFDTRAVASMRQTEAFASVIIFFFGESKFFFWMETLAANKFTKS